VRLIQAHTCIQKFAGSSAILFIKEGKKSPFFKKNPHLFLGLLFIIAVPIVKLFASGKGDSGGHVLMMMTFIFSYRNNNQPTAIYPFGTFPRALKKAHVMMLPSCPLWYYDDPFTPLLTWCAKLFTVQHLYSQHPFIQMTDTDVTFLPKYHNMDPDCLYVMVLTSPPSLSRSRLWAGLGVRWPSQLHPVIQGLPVLESLPFNSLSVPGNKKFTTDITHLANYNKLDLILPTQESSNVADVGTARLYGSSVQTPAGRRVSPGESRECSNNRPEDEQGCAES
jgi:hypothetical protein